MKLSILIVSWNTRDLLVKCINSILKHQPGFDYEIIVVDNRSQDGTVEALVSLFGHNKKIKVIPSLRNLGFAKGNNVAYEQSTGEYVLMLNPDTEVREQALQKLVEYLESHPAVGVAGPKIVNPDGSLQPSVRRFPEIWSSLLVFSGLHRFFRPRRYLMDDFSYEQTAEVDQVMGAALLIRRKIIEELGFLDDNFYLWYEEVDFCKRVKTAGYGVMFYPEAAVMHLGAQSFAQLAVYERKKTVAKSLVYFFRKNGSFWEVVAIRLIMPLVLAVAKIISVLQQMARVRIKPHV